MYYFSVSCFKLHQYFGSSFVCLLPIGEIKITRQVACQRTRRRCCYENKKLSYRRGTARCVVSVKILPIATQQCRNYLYDKS